MDVPRTIFGSPLARWLVTLIALNIIVYAQKEMRRALSSRFSERLNLRRLSQEAGPIVVGVGVEHRHERFAAPGGGTPLGTVAAGARRYGPDGVRAVPARARTLPQDLPSLSPTHDRHP